MATISITIPDASVARVRTAFGHWSSDLGDPVWIDATNNDVRDELTNYVRGKTRQYEERIAAQVAVAEVEDAL